MKSCIFASNLKDTYVKYFNNDIIKKNNNMKYNNVISPDKQRFNIIVNFIKNSFVAQKKVYKK